MALMESLFHHGTNHSAQGYTSSWTWGWIPLGSTCPDLGVGDSEWRLGLEAKPQMPVTMTTSLFTLKG